MNKNLSKSLADLSKTVESINKSSDDTKQLTSVVPTDSIDEGGEVDIIMNVESLIKQGEDHIEKLSDQVKNLSEMVNSALENDGVYRNLKQNAKEVSKELKKVKSKITSSPTIIETINKLKDIKAELRELKNAQQDYVTEYERMTGATQLELFDGSVMEIIKVCKLIKKRG